jgi:hypothetical protein
MCDCGADTYLNLQHGGRDLREGPQPFHLLLVEVGDPDGARQALLPRLYHPSPRLHVVRAVQGTIFLQPSLRAFIVSLGFAHARGPRMRSTRKE